MKKTDIEKLEKIGFKRWTKGQHDRLYINPESFGLIVERYKTGNVSYAELNGERISNSSAADILQGKYYIDVNTGIIVVSTRSYKSTIYELVTEILDRITA